MFIRCDEVQGLIEFGEAWLLDPENTDVDAWPWWRESADEVLLKVQMFRVVPVTVPAGRDLLVRWLQEGERCSCTGPVCTACVGTGYARKPHDCAWARNRPKALAECVRRVARGEEPLKGVLDQWADGNEHGVQWIRLGQRALYVAEDGYWSDDRDVHEGPETGEEGKAKADEAARAAGWWLL